MKGLGWRVEGEGEGVYFVDGEQYEQARDSAGDGLGGLVRQLFRVTFLEPRDADLLGSLTGSPRLRAWGVGFRI